jgi:uncharacterized membrane protein YdjX (TVP38/TMEM64 family)
MHNHKKIIHQELKIHAPHAVHKVKKLFGFKYPKLFLLTLMIILSYFIFSNRAISGWIESLSDFGYLGTFLGGIFIAFGFTAPIGIGLLIKLNISNIFLGAIIGGAGAMFSDIIIFKTIKFSFMNEFEQLEKTHVIQRIKCLVMNNKNILIKHYLLYIFAGIIIATPLPDELGVSMLAGLTTIKPLKFMIISFLLHAAAILILLMF